MNEVAEKKSETRPDAARDLTERQWRFVEEFFVDLNATKAIIRAGYEGTRARQTAHETLRSPKVAAAISELAPTYVGLSRAMILQGMGKIAMSGKDDGSKIQALDRLARITGLYKDGPQSATQVNVHIYKEEENL